VANETVVKVSADASGYMAELLRAKTSAQAFAVSQDALSARIKSAQDAITEATANGSKASTRNVNSFMTSLARQADQAGRTRAEILQMQAAMLGVSDAAKKYVDAIAKADSANSGHGHGGAAGIFREGLVMAHETLTGNFNRLGGSAMVMAERFDLTKYLTPTTLGLAGVAAEIAVVGAAAIKGAEDMKQFNAALTLTGNYAGLTRESLEAMTQKVSTASGESLSKSNEVLLSLAKSGQYTSDEMSGLASVILRTAEISGEKLEDVSKEYEKLAQDPAKWAAAHNESMHFMDVATYQHIAALQQAGDKHAAINAVIEAATAQVQQSSQTHLTVAAQAWKDLSGEVDKFWAKLKQGASSGPGIPDQITTLTNERSDITGNSSVANSSGGRARVAEIDKQVAALIDKMNAQDMAAQHQADVTRKNQAAIEAEVRIDKMRDQIMSNEQKRQKELKQLADDRASILAGGGKFSDTDYGKMVADINEKYKDPKERKPKEYHDDAGTTLLEEYRKQGAQLQAQLDGTDKLTESQRKLAELNQEISDWQGKTLTDQQKSTLAKQEELRAQLQINTAREKELAHRDAINKLTERSGQINDAIGAYQDNQREQYRRQLDTYGMGTEAQRRVGGEEGIYGYYNHQSEELTKSATKDGTLDSDKYKDALAANQAGLQQSLQLYDQYYDDLKQKQSDWTNGVATAMQDYVDKASNSAQQAQQVFENATKSMEDAITKFVTTGKINLQSLAQSIETAITRKIVQNGISSLFSNGSNILGSLGSSFFSGNTKVGANAASMLPGDALDNMMKLTKGFGTMGGPMNVANLQAAIQSASTLNAVTAMVTTMTVGTMVGSSGGGAGGSGGAGILGSLLNGLGGSDMAGSFGFTSTGVAASADAVGSGAGIGDGMSTLFGAGGSSAFADSAASVFSAMAGGGDVSGGAPYYVGEQGPELFVPGVSGSIVPHYALVNASDRTLATSSQAAGGSTFNMNIAVPPGSTQQTANQQAMAIMRQARIAMARNG